MNGKVRTYLIALLLCMPLAAYSQRVSTETGTLFEQGADTTFTGAGSEIVMEQPASDTLILPAVPDSVTLNRDSILRARKPLLDDVMTSKNKDSMVYNVRTKSVRIYEQGDVKYQDLNLKADYMEIDMENKLIFARGRPDTVTMKTTRPEFSDKQQSFTMDTLFYNLDSKKANATGLASQDGEGYLTGERVKKMDDNTLNIVHGKFTTCDLTHPHFYIAMSRAKAIPGKKVIIGPSYLVMEDVPIYFLGIPFGFFPMQQESNSGVITPSVGEESIKGFYLRNGGYYFKFNDYVDMALTGSIYTYGSWDAQAVSRYIKRYKYTGSVNLNYSKNIWGDKGSADYHNSNEFSVKWAHQQDPKAHPNSNFSASVNFATSGYSKFSSQTLGDYLETQKNSSISYSKSWPTGPFSISTNLQHSQSSRDTTVTLSFPNVVLNMSRIYPFKRRADRAVGRQRWYEKISVGYTGTMQNNVTVKEDELFSDGMFSKMRNGINHVIPITTNMSIFKYITISPTANYQERWFFKKYMQEWDPGVGAVVAGDTLTGFYRTYNYNFSMSASTKIYGTYQFKQNSRSRLKAIRHVLTPSISLSYVPDFSKSNYGFYETVQSDAAGNTKIYWPYDSMYGQPGTNQVFSLGFSLQQTLAMKLKDKDEPGDATKDKIISLIDQLSISSSYNFVLDSMNLSPFSISFRTKLIKNVGLNINASLDPYQIDANGRRINKFMWSKGSPGRITSVSTAFGYSFSSSKSRNPNGVANDINSAPIPEYSNPFDLATFGQTDPNILRQAQTAQYYDFNIPWNFGFNYSFNYSKPGLTSTINQTLGFNGSLTITDKWGVALNGGYDIQARKLTTSSISVTRDLHCWQMSFSWVPLGFRKSWNFTIRVKANMLKDLKYDRNSSFLDNLYR